MTAGTVYGQIINAPQVEKAVVAHLQLWMPDYLAEVARQTGMDATPPAPRTWTRKSSFDKLEEDQLPLITVVSPGTPERPQRDYDGLYRVTWEIRVGCIVSARDEASTRDLAGVYGAAVYTLMLQHPGVHPSSHGLEWNGESLDELDQDSARSMAAHLSTFQVELRDVVCALAGPIESSGDSGQDPEQDPGDLPTVETVYVDGHVAAPTP